MSTMVIASETTTLIDNVVHALYTSTLMESQSMTLLVVGSHVDSIIAELDACMLALSSYLIVSIWSMLPQNCFF